MISNKRNVPDFLGPRENDLFDFTIKDMLEVVSANLQTYFQRGDESYVEDARDLLNMILLTYKCERIGSGYYLFTADHDMFILNQPLYAGDNNGKRKRTINEKSDEADGRK